MHPPDSGGRPGPEGTFAADPAPINRHNVQNVQKVQNEPAAPRLLLTATQVQARLGVDRSTVYRMAFDGRLSAIKVGRQWRFPADAIEGLLAGPTRSTPSDLVKVRSAATALVEVTAGALGVMMLVTDMDGDPITAVANPCPWFVEHGTDDEVLAACVADWRGLADDVHLSPEFRLGPLGFECARSFVRSGHLLVGMVLAGGIAPSGNAVPGLYSLAPDERVRVMETLPRVAAALSRAVARPQSNVEISR